MEFIARLRAEPQANESGKRPLTIIVARSSSGVSSHADLGADEKRLIPLIKARN
jgi:hypothetical protein